MKLPLFRYLLTGIVVILLLIGSYYWLIRKTLIENFLSEEMNASVKIETVSLNWRGLTLQNVSASNLFQTKPIIKTSKLEIEFPLWEIFYKTINLKTLKIFNPTIYIDFLPESNENSVTQFLDMLPEKHQKKFKTGGIFIYVVEFKASESGKEFEVWPIPFLSIEEFKGAHSVSELTKIIFEKILNNMISTHPLPFKEHIVD